MQRIGLDKNWDFYESDESMSFVFATPPSQKVDLPHDFIVGKPRSADAPGWPVRSCGEKRRSPVFTPRIRNTSERTSGEQTGIGMMSMTAGVLRMNGLENR